jgi:DNA excision repair protein ERCC-4
MNEKTFEVIRDTREQDGWTFSRSKVIDNIIDQKLDTGDYTIVGLEDKICIERKATTSEVSANICEKRFFAELVRMQTFEFRFLVCEFDFQDILTFPKNSGIPSHRHKYVKISPQFIMKNMSEIQIKYGVNVIYAGSKQAAEILVDNLLRRLYEYYNEE